jgi:hypothetical protein
MRVNRWTLTGALFVGLVCVGFIVVANLSLPGVTKANFDRIQDNMTRREVENILGGSSHGQMAGGGSKSTPAQITHFWHGRAGQVSMTFDDRSDEGKIVRKEWWSPADFVPRIQYLFTGSCVPSP